MKHLRIVIITVMAICFSVVAQAQKANAKNKTTQKAATLYQCPMKCEGTKTYAKAGDCPECGMHLKAVAKTIAYQCPMKCEGDKTYAKEGNCPVCEMSLKPVDSKEPSKKKINPSNTHS